MRYYEFVTETAQESQILNLIADRAARYLLTNKTTRDTIGKILQAPIGGHTQFRDTVMLRNLGISPTDSPEINWVINNIEVGLVNKFNKFEPNTLGGYNHEDRVLMIFLPAVQLGLKHRNESVQQFVASILVHELQHALDGLKSRGRALGPNPSDDLDPDQAYQQYLRLPKEINARFAQALLDTARYVTRMDNRSQLERVIQVAFGKHQLTPDLFGDNTRQYRRLLSRTYKFFDDYIDAPYTFQPKPLAARAWSWITKLPTDTIKRTNQSSK
jgi:hypothetical protein